MKLGVYSWFPYQSPDLFTEGNDNTLLDSWVVSPKGRFTKDTDLFPCKVSSRYNECPKKTLLRGSHWDFITLFTVSQELTSLIRNLIPELILSHKRPIPMGPVRNDSGVIRF